MFSRNKILTGAASLAALVATAGPAAAQYYPAPPPPPPPGYGYGQPGGPPPPPMPAYGGYRYGNFGYGQTYRYGGMTIPAHVAVDQCARSLALRGAPDEYGRGGGRAQVTGITNIEPRSNGALRVHGVASTDRGYGYRDGYPNVSFTCKVDYSGRVIDLTLDRIRGGYRRY